MSESGASGALVCGFWDEASGLAASAWRLGGTTGGILAQGGETEVAEATLSESDGGATVELRAGETSCTAELSPRPGMATLTEGAEDGAIESAPCTATIKVEGGRTVQGHGHITRWARDPAESADLVRHLAMPASEGALLVLTAARGKGAEAHDAEATQAWLLDAEGTAVTFAEALLSTQYDESAHPTRAGVELWISDEDAPPMRAAGTGIGRSQGANGVSALVLRSSLEGMSSIGSYLIWRR